jgi:hypothetical protein
VRGSFLGGTWPTKNSASDIAQSYISWLSFTP